MSNQSDKEERKPVRVLVTSGEDSMLGFGIARDGFPALLSSLGRSDRLCLVGTSIATNRQLLSWQRTILPDLLGGADFAQLRQAVKERGEVLTIFDLTNKPDELQVAGVVHLVNTTSQELAVKLVGERLKSLKGRLTPEVSVVFVGGINAPASGWNVEAPSKNVQLNIFFERRDQRTLNELMKAIAGHLV